MSFDLAQTRRFRVALVLLSGRKIRRIRVETEPDASVVCGRARLGGWLLAGRFLVRPIGHRLDGLVECVRVVVRGVCPVTLREFLSRERLAHVMAHDSYTHSIRPNNSLVVLRRRPR